MAEAIVRKSSGPPGQAINKRVYLKLKANLKLVVKEVEILKPKYL